MMGRTLAPASRKMDLEALATLACLLAAALAGGCSDAKERDVEMGGGRESGWSQMQLPGVTRDAAYEAGVYAVQQWFRLAETSADSAVIRSATEEYEQKGGTGRIRDSAVGYRNRMRRTATLVVRPLGEGCVAKCRVQVERLDTADHRVFRRNDQFGDVPNETPIDREAAVSAKQDQVWTPMPRDRQLEREILNVLREQVPGKPEKA